jgi:2-(3-amino-3-carboxypropyl)histidine synthase
MGDVTYGACCIDDYSAKALDCDLIVHYGHSCLGNICLKLCLLLFLSTDLLVPIDVTDGVKVLYIFVDIKIDINHFIETVKFNIDKNNRIALVGTIQFATSIQVS